MLSAATRDECGRATHEGEAPKLKLLGEGALGVVIAQDPTRLYVDKIMLPKCRRHNLVVEELEHALARGANIICEITGYGATSDGADMVAPSGEGAERCMRMAMENIDGPIDYLNTHGTSTPVGDLAELGAIKNTFGDNCPDISSTKSLSGHSLGAAGVHEAIYCMLMMENNFVAGSAHIDNLDEKAEGLPIVLKSKDKQLNRVMSNSFGFGGTNATLVMEKYSD